MCDVTAIMLAAGLSQRMGARNKLLLTIGAVPLIRHVVDVYSAVARVLVITGHQASQVTAVLYGSAAATTFNPDYANGQQTHVASGLRAVSAAGTILIGLGDQPLLTADDLRAGCCTCGGRPAEDFDPCGRSGLRQPDCGARHLARAPFGGPQIARLQVLHTRSSQ